MKIIEFYNPYHLGDAVFQIHYLNKLIDKFSDIKAIFYTSDSHHNELLKLINEQNKKKIELVDIKYQSNNAICSWIGTDNFYFDKYRNVMEYVPYEKMYVEWFNLLSKKNGLETPIKTEQDMLIDSSSILLENQLSRNCEILFINSIPKSNQYDYNKSEWDKFIISCSEKYKCVTTLHVNGSIPCTIDYNLSLSDIGNISINCKYIIAIHTGPIICTFNKWSIEKVNKWFIFDKKNTFTYNNKMLFMFNKSINDIDGII